MVRWAMEDGPVGGARGWRRKGTKPAGASGIPVMGSGLIEPELRESVGRSRWRRMRRVVEGSVMSEMILISPPQGGAQDLEHLVDPGQELCL